MKKKNNLWRCLGFLGGFVVLVAIASVFFRPKGGLQVYDALSVGVKTYAIEAEEDDSLDVLFFGDSESYSAFSPQELYSKYGYTSYVCGTAGQRICDTYAILTECFKTQSPKVIVLETNCLYRKLKKKDSSDLVLNQLSRTVPLFKNHTRWKLALRRMLPKSRQLKKSAQKGFVVRKDVKPYKGGAYMKKTKKKRKIPDDIEEYLEKIENLCEDNGARLLLVSTPSPANWDYKKHNAVNAWCKQHNADYLDLNLEDGLAIDWKKDTKDAGDHLNLSGAKKVTKFMGEYLGTHYSLEDHRDSKEKKK